jgi:signal transduction histidine kinase
LIEEQRNIKEKEKIIRDLHDGIGGITASIKLLADMGQNIESVSQTQKMFTNISELSKESLFEIRGFFSSLDVRNTSWAEFVSQLDQFARNMLSPHNIQFTSHIDPIPQNMPCDSLVFLILFRIYKESLANVVKHARASTVAVTFSLTRKMLSIRIRDDGMGLPDSIRHGRGLSNMKARADELGGTLEIISDQGTTVSLHVPMPINYVIEED